ncbi:DUF3267 domain-containing protein [Carnobacterium gallinarum]|uniref:DUF3267 domain-containing protein n=1 Tax=Carnobacterium gallinarum TaxID=2749 RepID=UPI00068E2F09|nr:DUF3267 domain-containing protein [Carnobacterium gallinarum]
MKANLVVIKKVNLFADTSLINQLSRGSLLIFCIVLLFSVCLFKQLPATSQIISLYFSQFDWAVFSQMLLFISKWVIYSSGAFFISLIIHEGIHGVFFKVFGAKKVQFGFKRGMAYAGAPGSFYRGWQFLILALSPFLILTGVYWVIGQQFPVFALFLFALHSAGCIGDFYYAYLVVKYGLKLWIEDTNSGLIIYRERKSDSQLTKNS